MKMGWHFAFMQREGQRGPLRRSPTASRSEPAQLQRLYRPFLFALGCAHRWDRIRLFGEATLVRLSFCSGATAGTLGSN